MGLVFSKPVIETIRPKPAFANYVAQPRAAPVKTLDQSDLLTDIPIAFVQYDSTSLVLNLRLAQTFTASLTGPFACIAVEINVGDFVFPGIPPDLIPPDLNEEIREVDGFGVPTSLVLGSTTVTPPVPITQQITFPGTIEVVLKKPLARCAALMAGIGLTRASFPLSG